MKGTGLKMMDYMVLAILEKKSAASRAYGLTLNEINDQQSGQLVSRKYLQRLVKHLERAGYLAEGYLDGNAKTYYLTEKGVKLVKEEQAE